MALYNHSTSPETQITLLLAPHSQTQLISNMAATRLLRGRGESFLPTQYAGDIRRFPENTKGRGVTHYRIGNSSVNIKGISPSHNRKNTTTSEEPRRFFHSVMICNVCRQLILPSFSGDPALCDAISQLYIVELRN
jgi:hypothetical protein